MYTSFTYVYAHYNYKYSFLREITQKYTYINKKKEIIVLLIDYLLLYNESRNKTECSKNIQVSFVIVLQTIA